jgi:hypothetical protein
MKAAILEAFGKPLVVDDVPDPKIGQAKFWWTCWQPAFCRIPQRFSAGSVTTLLNRR